MGISRFTPSHFIIFISFITFSGSWVSFGLNSFDSQLWPLIGSSMLLFYFSTIKKFNVFIATISFFSFTILLVQQLIFGYPFSAFLRILASYMIFYSVYFAGISIPLRYLDYCKKVFVFINYVWVFFAILQYVFPPFRYLVGRASASRGVNSFAAEAGFFALYLIFSSLIIYVLSGFNYMQNFRTHVINILSIFFLASSMVGILFGFATFFVIVVLPTLKRIFLSFRIDKRLLASFLLLIALTSVLVYYIFLLLESQNLSRLARLVYIIFNSSSNFLIEVFSIDASSNGRLFHTVAPYNVLFDNFGLPSTLVGFTDIGPEYAQRFSGFFWHNISSGIMTWHGEIFLSLGAFGIISTAILALFPRPHPRSFCILLLLPILLHATLPVAFPLIPLLFAFIQHQPNDIYQM